ncbi:MAG TPA: 3,4-dihydroxy-2-butanone-4-phosphate synthase [Methylophaga sp.]|nr:3,4-dihydroxy-2-butanone-4-phosphate synthase [Methylophaga sp.]HEC59182.1 3,4-dihydroxy-2-butanone-4-phosphate synthase [Methylophaga sp.]
MNGISPITDIIKDMSQGKMIVLIDDEGRENEGDLILAAEFVTPEHINFMARYGRGLICLTLNEARCHQLDLPLMVKKNKASMGTNFTVSIEAAEGVTTGISTADRARTIQATVAKDAKPQDIVKPGHIFPLMAQNGGVLARAGHTEAGCDLAELAGLEPSSVICEILKEDGNMARLPDLLEFAAEHHLKIGRIADLIQYRNQTETLVERISERTIKTTYGYFNLIAYRDRTTQQIHIALVYGKPDPKQATLVRVHEPLSLIDLLDMGSSTHSWGINGAMAAIEDAGCGVIVLLRRNEDEDDLLKRIEDTAIVQDADYELRDFGIGAQILKDIGVKRMRLMTNPKRMPNLTGFELQVEGYISPKSDDEMMEYQRHYS